MQLTKNQQERVFAWKLLVEELAQAKATEMKVRKELSEELFSDAKLGSNNLDLGHGYKLNFTKKETIRVDEAALASIKFPDGILEKTIVWKASFSNTGYKFLDKKYAKMLDEALITKPASPTLKFIEPKEV